MILFCQNCHYFSIFAVTILGSQKVIDLSEIIYLNLLLTKRHVELGKQELLALAETILSELPVSNANS